MMGNTTELIISSFLSALLSGSIAWLFTLKYTRKQAEADAMKSMQSVYQGLIDDLKKDREELKKELGEVKKIAERNTWDISLMKPALCGRKDCTNRTAFNFDNQ